MSFLGESGGVGGVLDRLIPLLQKNFDFWKYRPLFLSLFFERESHGNGMHISSTSNLNQSVYVFSRMLLNH